MTTELNQHLSRTVWATHKQCVSLTACVLNCTNTRKLCAAKNTQLHHCGNTFSGSINEGNQRFCGLCFILLDIIVMFLDLGQYLLKYINFMIYLKWSRVFFLIFSFLSLCKTLKFECSAKLPCCSVAWGRSFKSDLKHLIFWFEAVFNQRL